MSAQERPNAVKLVVLLGAVALGAILPFACDNQPEPRSSRAPPSPRAAPAEKTPSAAGEPTRSNAGGELRWTKPDTWKEIPTESAMRKATYQIPRASGDGEDGELTVIVAGGSTDANIQRWEGQFGGAKAKTTTRAPNGITLTIAEIDGDFAGGGPMMGGDGKDKKVGFLMLAAIADAAGGQKYFFKLTGPKKTIEAARGDFDKLIGSITR